MTSHPTWTVVACFKFPFNFPHDRAILILMIIKNKITIVAGAITILLVAIACTSMNSRTDGGRFPAATDADRERARAYLETEDGKAYVEKLKDLSAASGGGSASSNTVPTQKGPNQVSVFLPNRPVTFVPAPATVFNIQGLQDVAAIAELSQLLVSRQQEFSSEPTQALTLNPVHVAAKGERTFVRFQQVLRHRVGQSGDMTVPVEGASLVAVLVRGRLDTVTSSLMNPPSGRIFWTNPGLDIRQLSSGQLNLFLSSIKSNPVAVDNYLNEMARNSGSTFNMAAFKTASRDNQKAMLTDFLLNLKSVTVRKALIRLATKNRLALVRYDKQWMVQVTGFLDLPIQFDIGFPAPQEKPRIVNVRSLHQQISFNVFTNPTFPAPPATPVLSVGSETGRVDANTSAGRTVSVMQQIVQYYQNFFNWQGYEGRNPNSVLNIYTDATGPLVAGNAAWVRGGFNVMVIGVSGEVIQNLGYSPSVLGHEFTHAVVEATSQLAYNGESGALNEHFADIMGVGIKSYINQREFDYTIGEDSLNPRYVMEQAVVMQLLLAAARIPQEQIQAYSLTTVGIRHLYFPLLGYTRQISNVSEAVQKYGRACQPSADNDMCGVHDQSGIPNRAISQLIQKFGFKRLQEMIFNTVTLRLSANATFLDYRRQLFAECWDNRDLRNQGVCDAIPAAFNEVGITDTGAPTPQPTPARPAPQQPQQEPMPYHPEPDEPAPQPTEETPPAKTYCGWVRVAQSSNIEIEDYRFNAVVLMAKYAPTVLTTISRDDFRQLSGWRCACVHGPISKIPNSNGVLFNHFIWVDRVSRHNDCQNH